MIAALNKLRFKSSSVRSDEGHYVKSKTIFF